ncbi:hypothetical protein DM02DRAFT_580630 [Periconia macrospinosa]|uniref:C2H2-type domain-containing protein n=1 Tax=Periconia macrospinosa TaxID=97972 RepID=A0A2V1E9Y6_9PLEO|nr:hypothetical protein DM02DRAFT_580630 [Periconia macrospinosa]
MAPRPQRNAPLPNAIHTFKCDLCDKGYSRQVDYENHLGSYDHNHRQRAAGAKEITAGQSNNSRPKGNIDMRKLPTTDSVKTGVGSRFTKIGGPSTNTAVAGSRFKKVGVAVGENTDSSDTTANLATDATAKATENPTQDEIKTAEEIKVDKSDIPEEEASVSDELSEMQEYPSQDADVAMADAEEDDEEDDEEEEEEEEKEEKKEEVKEEKVKEEKVKEPIDWEKYERELLERTKCCEDPNCPGNEIIDYEVDEDGWLKIDG